MANEKIVVLMSTYNVCGGGAEDFLHRQLASILGQRDVEISLYIRDDGSKDNTIEIINEYSDKYKNITIIQDGANLGACRSFLKLMATEIDAEFFSLADQDDIWDEDKLSVAIDKLKTLPQDKPALYYSNQRVVDEDNNFIRISHAEPQVAINKYGFLADPLAAGCTCVYNRKLAEIAWRTKPETYSMHDTWIYNAAAMFGNVVYDFEPHMNYRQHNANVIGTPKKQFSLDGIKKQLHYYLDWKSQPRYKCVLLMEKQWKGLMNPEQKHMVGMITGYKKSIVKRIQLFNCKDMYPATRYRKIRWKLMILLGNI